MVVVRSTEDLKQAIAAGIEVGNIQVQSNAEDLANAKSAGFKEGHAAGRLEAAKAFSAERLNLINGRLEAGQIEGLSADLIEGERSRVLNIQGLTEPGFEAVARNAIDSGISVEQFAMKQMEAIKDRGITMRAITADSPPAAPFAPSPAGVGSASRATSPQSTYERRRKEASAASNKS